MLALLLDCPYGGEKKKKKNQNFKQLLLFFEGGKRKVYCYFSGQPQTDRQASWAIENYPLCTRICPCPLFEVTPPGAAPGPRLKLGHVFVASGGVNMRNGHLENANLIGRGTAAKNPE